MPDLWRFFITLEILVDRRILMLNSFKKEGRYRCVMQLYCPRTGAHTGLMEMDEDFMGPTVLIKCSQTN
jgi:hypothetical protein